MSRVRWGCVKSLWNCQLIRVRRYLSFKFRQVFCDRKAVVTDETVNGRQAKKTEHHLAEATEQADSPVLG